MGRQSSTLDVIEERNRGVERGPNSQIKLGIWLQLHPNSGPQYIRKDKKKIDFGMVPENLGCQLERGTKLRARQGNCVQARATGRRL